MHHVNQNYFCFIDDFRENLINNLSKNVSIIYRNYNKYLDINTIIKIKKTCKKKRIKFYLSNNIKLALKLNLDGAYIPSFNKNYHHNSYNYRKKFTLLGSAHNLKEIRIKEEQNVKIIFIAPIFFNKKNKIFLGIYKFMNLKKLTKNKTVCLGGINKDNIKILSKLNIKGIAGISMFN